MIYYHLSKNGYLVELTPKIPNDVIMDYEDEVTPRVSVAPTIEQCLMALPYARYRSFFVYEINIDGLNVEQPTKHQVPDVVYTEELWILEKVYPKLIGEVVVRDVEKSVSFIHEGESFNVFYYDFDFLPIEQADKSYEEKLEELKRYLVREYEYVKYNREDKFEYLESDLEYEFKRRGIDYVGLDVDIDNYPVEYLWIIEELVTKYSEEEDY